jgi:hypothetical protein
MGTASISQCDVQCAVRFFGSKLSSLADWRRLGPLKTLCGVLRLPLRLYGHMWGGTFRQHHIVRRYGIADALVICTWSN